MTLQAVSPPAAVIASGQRARLLAFDETAGFAIVDLADGRRMKTPLRNIQTDDQYVDVTSAEPAPAAPAAAATPARPAPPRAVQDTHIWEGDELAAAEPGLRRQLAIALWLVSFLGNALAFGLTFHWPLVQADVIGIGGGLVLQLVVSYIQFVTCVRRTQLYYLALIVSFVPSWLGYRFVAVWATQRATGMAGDVFASLDAAQAATAAQLAWAAGMSLLLAIALIVIDVIPERVFIRLGKEQKRAPR